ncbi:F-box only protein 15-like [Chelmon rostratus]|uniref:F-box only protein 15-like n=1 Tax=Chelmon rostratus TaxID=109905 RepID=UPI001BE9E3B7|nr:F-box only protein 15-like [Chelmon rostratus]
MAAGRGEFFRSFLAGLEKKPGQPAPGVGQLGRGRGSPGEGQTGGRRRKAALSSVSGNDLSCPEPRTERRKDFLKINNSSSQENFMERLPSEILIKILSFLDASSLFCISHVSKLFHKLANDDVTWYEIYMSEFGRQTWKPKLADDTAPRVDPVEVEDQSRGHWKRLYLRTMVGQQMSRWKRELREISPHTGLPRQTEWVLRNLNVSWELTVCNCRGRENTLEQSRVYFFESSVIVRWSGGRFPKYHHIRYVQLHGVRKYPNVRKPDWRSLILNLDIKRHRGRLIGKDRLIKLMHLVPGFTVGIWRVSQNVAFIMVSLHFHRLVERSLLGSPVSPYSEPVHLPPVDNLDPEFGLHGYTLHFVLHNTSTEIMSGHFCQLSCRRVQIQCGLLEFRVISRTDLSQHRSLSGNITLPWQSETLEGSVENCCIITLTLLDEFHKPFWCVSSPVCTQKTKNAPSGDYSGECFLMQHRSSEGKVQMNLVWLKEQKQFFLVSLTVYVPVYKVNRHFSTEY